MSREKLLGIKKLAAENGGRAVRILLLALVALTTLASVGIAQSEPSDSNPPPIQWSACPPTPDLPDAGMECATLRLPLDYRAPHGRKIDVAISRIRSANPGARRGVLLLNPGGPGGPGVDIPRLFFVLLPQSVLDRYDLIGFDPRFVGTSTPVTCGLTEQEAIQALVPLEQPGGFPATVSFMHEVADRCDEESGDVLRFATTANTARDMDRIRQALGEAKISYFGYSYGTYLGAVYASLFPGRTDRVVLDSSVHPRWVWRPQFRSWGPGGELRFPDFANFAAANDATYHLGDTPREVSRLFFDLLERADENPLVLPDGTILDGPMFRVFTFSGLYFDSSFPDTAALWQMVNESSDSAAAQEAIRNLRRPPSEVDVPVDNSTASGLAILCGDIAWPRSVEEYRQGFLSDSRRFPMFGSLGSNIWPCAFWHSQPPEPPVPITPNGPRNILILQNRRDPATPYPGGPGMREALGQRARLVSVDQGGHTVYLLTPNVCGNDVTTAFLVDGTLPGGDISCPASAAAELAPSPGSDRERAIRELQRRVRW